MHLSHKIPWSAASTQFTLVADNKHYTPAATDVYSTRLPDHDKFIGHFSRVFAETIREFSDTMKNKTLPKAALDESRPVFSDEIRLLPEELFDLEDHQTNSLKHNPLGVQHQDLNYWKAEAPEGHYSTSQADLADVVKTLIISSAVCEETKDPRGEEAFTDLLRLAKTPGVPLQDLDMLSWGHGFGVECLVHETINIYILMNVVEACNDARTKAISLLKTDTFRQFARNAWDDYDYPAQNLPHVRFWKSCGMGDFWAWEQNGEEIVDPVLNAGEAKQRYMKTCFGILYRYDVLLRMWRGDEYAKQFWEEQTEWVLGRWRPM